MISNFRRAQASYRGRRRENRRDIIAIVYTNTAMMSDDTRVTFDMK